MKFPVLKWVKYYYASTVLFIVLDLTLGANVRAVGFEAFPTLRILYYIGCLGCFVVILKNPHWSAPIVLGESIINLLSLIMGLFTPIYVYIPEGNLDKAYSILSIGFVINFAIAASIALISFYQSQSAIEEYFKKRR